MASNSAPVCSANLGDASFRNFCFSTARAAPIKRCTATSTADFSTGDSCGFPDNIPDCSLNIGSQCLESDTAQRLGDLLPRIVRRSFDAKPSHDEADERNGQTGHARDVTVTIAKLPKIERGEHNSPHAPW
jgi:hypothetical protein